MNETDLSDENLMAYADGQLDAATAARIEARIATDPAMAERVALFGHSRDLTRGAFAELRSQPVPDALADRVSAMVRKATEEAAADRGTADVVPFPVRTAAARPRAAWYVPLAASIAAAVAGGAGYMLGSAPDRTPDGTSLEVARATGSEIAALLATAVSGETRAVGRAGHTMEIIATFRVGDTLCRELELDNLSRSSTVAVSCLTDGAWTTAFAVMSDSSAGAFVPASSSDAVEGYLSAIEAGPALLGDEETAALSAARKP